MAITVVQQQTSTDGVAASKSITLSPAGTAGNKLIVVATIFSNTQTLSPTTPAAGNWTLDLTANPAASGQSMRWYSMDLAGGETTITFTNSDSPTTHDISIIAYEVSGLVSGATAADKAVSSTFTTGTSKATTTTGTLTQADEIGIAAVMINGASGGAEAWDSAFNISTTNVRAWAGYKIVSATTALNPTASWTTSRSVHAGIVTYKLASATNATPTPAVVAGIGAQPAATEQTGETVSGVEVAGIAGIDSMGAEITATVTPSSVAGVAAQPAPTLTATSVLCTDRDDFGRATKKDRMRTRMRSRC